LGATVQLDAHAQQAHLPRTSGDAVRYLALYRDHQPLGTGIGLQEVAQNGGGDGIGEVAYNEIGSMGCEVRSGQQLSGGELQDITLDDGHPALMSQETRQGNDQIPIQLHSDHSPGGLGEETGESP